MKTMFPEIITRNSLFLWFINRLSDEFGDHAILKGGIALQLYDCPRSTNDLDYLFIPYKSKKEIIQKLKIILHEIPDKAETINITLNSKVIQVHLVISGVSCQMEGNVALECKSEPISTKPLADKANEMSRIIRIMSPDISLSHKLAAWNERRLLRDLYDIYYLFLRMKVLPNMDTLVSRLNNLQSRLPKLKKVKQMSIQQFITELEDECNQLTTTSIKTELGPLLDETELTGMKEKIKVAITGIIEYIKNY